MKKNNITSVPVLNVSGKMLDFYNAVQYVNGL
jgi:hypothetical protein